MNVIRCCLFLMTVGLSPEETDSYESALIAAVHRFARDGELHHLKAILEKHPRFVDLPERFRQPHKPTAADAFAPLHQAAFHGRDKVAAYLLHRGANVNVADGFSRTPLHIAANWGHLSIVKLLLKHGAKVNVVSDGRKWTPLHLAAKRGHLSIVKLLVRHGADRDLKTRAIPESSGPFPNGSAIDPHSVPEERKTLPAIPSRTALECAVEAKHNKVVKYLKSLPTSPDAAKRAAQPGTAAGRRHLRRSANSCDIGKTNPCSDLFPSVRAVTAVPIRWVRDLIGARGNVSNNPVNN